MKCSYCIFDADNDEPLLSGSGAVSKDVTDEELLENWAEVSKVRYFCPLSKTK